MMNLLKRSFAASSIHSLQARRNLAAGSVLPHQAFLAGFASSCRSFVFFDASPGHQQLLENRSYHASEPTTMPLNIIITGATGTAGSGALRQAIADPDVARITVLSRRPLGIQDEKLRVIIHSDFSNYDDIASHLVGHQAALWCLGISQRQVTKAEYDVITYDYAIAAAKAFGAANPDSFRFLFLSGQGADSSEQSRFTFARVKGKTENALFKLGHPSSVSFRPGYIQPDFRAEVSFGGKVADFLSVGAHRYLPNQIITATNLGKGMLEVAKHGSEDRILTNIQILDLAKQFSARSSEAKS